MRKQQVEIIFFLSKDVLATQPFNPPNHSSNYWLNTGAATISLFLRLLACYGLVEYEAYLAK